MAEDLDVGLLDQRQGVALVIEAQAAQSLLRDATVLIRRIKVAIDDQHSVLAVASIGVEKLLKLSIQNHESARTATNELIATSLLTWRSAIYQGWMHGALGTRARQLSSAIEPEN